MIARGSFVRFVAPLQADARGGGALKRDLRLAKPRPGELLPFAITGVLRIVP